MPANDAKESLSISMEGWLIELLDVKCKEQFLTRSDFIRRAVRKEILSSFTDDRTFWRELYQKHQNQSY